VCSTRRSGRPAPAAGARARGATEAVRRGPDPSPARTLPLSLARLPGYLPPAMFSRHTAWTAGPGPLDLALAGLQRAGIRVLDLTVSNPTALGFTYPAECYRGLVDERSAQYDAASLGLASARTAVADYYTRRGAAPLEFDPDAIGLCASSSEAYTYLLALLCDPGDAVLVPQPGYPLLRMIAELARVELVPYPLLYDGTWSIDQVGLELALAATPRARALVVVAPNNPTGNYLAPAELHTLDTLLAARDIAMLVDEVFWDYPLIPGPHTSPALGPRGALTFILSGLSKVAALPQLKLAWWLTLGPPALVSAAMARLELIADTYLSAATPVQLALPDLLAAAPAMQARISARCRHNLELLRHTCRDTAMTVLDLEAGWTALLRLPAVHDLDDAAWALHLLQHGHILTQPGHLFDLDDPPRLALSLLTPEPEFTAACERLPALVARVLASEQP